MQIWPLAYLEGGQHLKLTTASFVHSASEYLAQLSSISQATDYNSPGIISRKIADCNIFVMSSDERGQKRIHKEKRLQNITTQPTQASISEVPIRGPPFSTTQGSSGLDLPP